MIQPSARRASAPAPPVRSSGRPPSTVAIIVITTGRRRISAGVADRLAHRLALVAELVGELDDQDAVLRHQADQHHEADLAVDVDRAAGEQDREHRRGEAEGHGRHQDQRR